MLRVGWLQDQLTPTAQRPVGFRVLAEDKLSELLDEVGELPRAPLCIMLHDVIDALTVVVRPTRTPSNNVVAQQRMNVALEILSEDGRSSSQLRLPELLHLVIKHDHVVTRRQTLRSK